MGGIAKKFGLAVAGTALVDVLSRVDDAFVAEQPDMVKGASNLIGHDRVRALENIIPIAAQTMSGGSGANSLAGFASFGGPNGSRGAMIGKVGSDSYGRIFRDDMAALNLYFATPEHDSEPTGRSYIMITPDGERTMNTFLGAGGCMGPDDVDADVIAGAGIVLLEGYAFDNRDARAALEKIVPIAKDAGTTIAFTLSDAQCVKRHHADFVAMVRDHADIVFGNEKESAALTLKNDFNAAAREIAAMCGFSALTRGSKGAVILQDGRAHDIAPVKPVKLVDTTGAGDAFAAGVLYGLSQGMPAPQCGGLGARAASATIGHVGARSPSVKFSDFLV